MIERKFDPDLAYRYATYARMSTKRQNERSTTQQRDNIEGERQKQSRPWVKVKDYEDKGKSGRLTLKRPGLQQLLGDVRSGTIKIDLLLLDTFDRLGRNNSLLGIQRELYEEFGVLILTVDSHFIDPNTASGTIYSAFQALKAKEDNRIKAHQVLRGKVDTVKLGYWPGGEPPFGFRLQSEIGTVDGLQDKIGSRLVLSLETDWIARLSFERARDTGDGQTRIAIFLNAHPDIDPIYKPFSGSSIGWMFDSELYKGEFHFPKHATDIVDDVVIKELVSAEECKVYPNFCPAIVTAETWDIVQSVRAVRRDNILRRRARSSTEKLIAPLVKGISVRYLLSGLLRCGHCGSAMRPTGTSKLNDPNGNYVYYRCPRNIDGACDNSTTVREAWIRSKVVEYLATRLFESHMS